MATQRVGAETHLSNETRCAGGVFSDRAPQCPAVAHPCVDGLSQAIAGRDPLLQQSLESLCVELSEQQAEGGIRRRPGDMGAEQLVEEADQIGCGSGVLERRGQGCASRRGQQPLLQRAR